MNNNLKLTMERGRLVLELPDSALDLEVNGALQATYFLGRSDGPEDLRGELRKANAARAACTMLNELVAPMKLPSDKRVSDGWVEGFRHGLAGNHRVLNDVHVQPVAVTTAGGMAGWELGYAIRAALAIAAGKPDPRQSPDG